jgi:hypothetical protein
VIGIRVAVKGMAAATSISRDEGYGGVELGSSWRGGHICVTRPLSGPDESIQGCLSRCRSSRMHWTQTIKRNLEMLMEWRLTQAESLRVCS